MQCVNFEMEITTNTLLPRTSHNCPLVLVAMRWVARPISIISNLQFQLE